jgi:hypothetical protein
MESSGWDGDFSNVSFGFRNRMGAFSVNPCFTFFGEFGSFFERGFILGFLARDFWRVFGLKCHCMVGQ